MSKNQVSDTIKAFLMAGKGDTIFICHREASPKNKVKKLKKRLNSSKSWSVHEDTIWGGDGISFNGIASWSKNATILLGHHEYRFSVLQIDRWGYRTSYAIPINMVGSFSSLPGIELNVAEIGLIKAMANELSTKGPVNEELYCIFHPAKASLIENRDQWTTAEFDRSELLRMIQANQSLRPIIIAALAAQYRSFLPGAVLPEGIYNFIIPSKCKDSDRWFYTVLHALTFANDPGKNLAGPIIISLKEADDLKRWRRCHERLAVIRTARGDLLWPLLEDIEESDQFLRSGGVVSPPLPAVPISLTRAYLHHPQAVDIPLSDNPPTMTDKQLDLLRAAMSLLLRRKTAQSALQSWREGRTQTTAYRTNGFSAWYEILLKTCLNTWFPGAEYQSACERILTDTQHQREEQERAVEETLGRGLELLTDPSRYIDEIIERPSSREAWDEASQNGKLAFWYTPKKGDDEGVTFLAFTPKTLKLLISRVGCNEDLYGAFLKRCENQSLLDQKNRTITLTQGQITAITFLIEKP